MTAQARPGRGVAKATYLGYRDAMKCAKLIQDALFWISRRTTPLKTTTVPPHSHTGLIRRRGSLNDIGGNPGIQFSRGMGTENPSPRC
jgi:hypothetical protein